MSAITEYVNVSCKLEINLLGGLCIQVDGVPCEIDFRRSKQVLLLLEYLITNRFTAIPIEQYADVLWAEKGEDKEVDNPQGALKNLVWRCRRLLSQALPAYFTEELILFSGNTYCFNNALHCSIDIEELEDIHRSLNAPGLGARERIRRLERVVELYRGDFLPRLSGCDWVSVRSAYYKRIYVDCVDELLSIYLKNELYAKVIQLSENALQYEQYNENIHCAYMHALAETDRMDQAIAHYEKVADSFSRNLGISVSPELSRFYNRMQKIRRNEGSIQQILGDINEESQKSGCYYCSYEVLKNIYRVQSRGARRNRESLSVIVVTIQGELSIHNIAAIMEKLRQIISVTLRTADYFARCSINQFLIVLSNADRDNASKVCKRVGNAFHAFGKKAELHLSFSSMDSKALK